MTNTSTFPYELLGDPAAMLTAIDQALQQQGLPTDLPCDHICYRVASLERYHQLRDLLSRQGKCVGEELVNGRPISIFQLKSALTWKNQTIACLELPAPKPNSTYVEGWEHAEFVTGRPLSEFMRRYPHVNFEQKSLRNKINPEISFKISGGYQVKFHPTDILSVLAEEENLRQKKTTS